MAFAFFPFLVYFIASVYYFSSTMNKNYLIDEQEVDVIERVSFVFTIFGTFYLVGIAIIQIKEEGLYYMGLA